MGDDVFQQARDYLNNGSGLSLADKLLEYKKQKDTIGRLDSFARENTGKNGFETIEAAEKASQSSMDSALKRNQPFFTLGYSGI